jgi:hypothetical protein
LRHHRHPVSHPGLGSSSAPCDSSTIPPVICRFSAIVPDATTTVSIGSTEVDGLLDGGVVSRDGAKCRMYSPTPWQHQHEQQQIEVFHHLAFPYTSNGLRSEDHLRGAGLQPTPVRTCGVFADGRPVFADAMVCKPSMPFSGGRCTRENAGAMLGGALALGVPSKALPVVFHDLDR